MSYSSTFGPLVARSQVAQAVVDVLKTPPSGSAAPLLAYFIAEVERQEGLKERTIAIPAESSYGTALDFERFFGDGLPAVVVVAQPTGDAERYDAGSYAQAYDIQVGVTCEDTSSGDERVVQQFADWYGIAVTKLLLANGGLGNPTAFTVDRTRLVAAPKTEFVDPTDRKFARSVSNVHSLVELVVTEQGPQNFGPDPYVAPQPWPTATTVKIELETEAPDESISPATGAAIVFGDGVTVTE